MSRSDWEHLQTNFNILCWLKSIDRIDENLNVSLNFLLSVKVLLKVLITGEMTGECVIIANLGTQEVSLIC